MAGRKACLLVALLLGGVFAGCIGSADEPAATVEPQGGDFANTTLGENETTETPDGRGGIAAFEETNRTESGTGGMMHSHDYWGDKTRIELFSANMWFIPLPVWPCRSGSPPNGDCYNPGTSIADIDIPMPMLVYEGTKQVEVVFKDFCVGPTREAGSFRGVSVPCVPNPQVRFGFDYLTAADDPGEWRQGGYVEEGVPVVLPIKPNEADMPHQAKSFWLFRIYTEHATSVTFNFTVTAVKGNQIADWPPHPDLYADKTERVVLEAPTKTETKGWTEYWLTGNDANWIHPDKVISYGTDRLDITVTKRSFANGAGVDALQPDFFYLEYHNATFISKMGNGDLAGGRLYDEGTDGETYHFTLEVTENDMDTPYATQSRWGFRFMARYSSDTCPQDEQWILQGCQWFPYTLEYDIKIVAVGHSTANEGIADPNAPAESSEPAEPTPTTPPPAPEMREPDAYWVPGGKA